MKTLLCSLNASYTHSAYPLYCIKSVADKRYDLEIAQFTINQTKDKILSALIKKAAGCYMFSCYIWNITETLNICSDLKKITNATIVLGGSEVAYTANEYIKLPYIDAIACGEGERLINPLLKCLNEQTDIGLTENIVTKSNPQKAYFADDFDFSLRPFPYTDGELYELRDKIIYYETERGCIYNCAYCISEIDKKIRCVSVDTVKKELDIFCKNGIKLVKFIDRTFNYDTKRAEEIIEYIIKKNYDMRFHFEIKAEICSPRLIELFNSAPIGMFQLEIGLQSVTKDVLSASERTTDLKKFAEIFTLLRKNNNIHLHADLIAMLPNETYISFADGYNYLYNLKPHMLQLGFLKILKGTQFYKNATRLGLNYSLSPPYEVLFTKSISYEQKNILSDIAYLTDKLYNSASFSYTLSETEKIYTSPFFMFEDIVNYANKIGYMEAEHSKRDLYKLLYDFLAEHADSRVLLAFDYLINVGNTLPAFLFDCARQIKKEELWNIMLTDAFTAVCPDELKMLPIKELIKYTDIYEFDINPITRENKKTIYAFFKLKDNGLIPQYRHYPIS